MSTEPASTVHCPLCGGKAVPVFAGLSWPLHENGRSFHYARCPACDAMFADPQPTAEEIEWLYGHRYDYSWFIRRRGLKRIQAAHRWRRLRDIFQALRITDLPRRMLDVGGGHAWFLRAAQADGWETEGLELLDDELAATAGGVGVTLHHGSLIAHSLPANTYHLVTAWHVVEHIPEIRGAVAAIAELLAPGGIGVIAVPNYRAAGMTRAGLAWVWCQKPFIHPWHLSATTLRSLLPSSLEILLLTSRDTWDAQWAESTAPFRFLMKAIPFAARIPRKAATILSWKRAVASCDRLQFWAEEALRLATYAVYLTLRPVLRQKYEEALRGSELMLVVRKLTEITSSTAGTRRQS